MNIIPKGAPAPVPVTSPESSYNKAQAARAKAVSMIQGNAGQTEQSPVQNQNQISPEEFSAVRQKMAPEVNELPVVEDTAGLNEPAKAPEDPLSTQYAQLARREKQLRLQEQKRQQAYKAKDEANAAREAQILAKEQEYKSGYISKSDLQKDTLRILNEANVPYDQLVQRYIDETTNPVDPRVNATISQLQAQIAELKAANEESKKFSTESEQRAYDQAVAVIRQDAVTLVKQNPEQYEGILSTKSIDDVVDLIKRTHAEEGRIMSVEEAAEEVENYIIEESYKVSELKKVRARREQARSAQPAQVVKAQPQSQPMKTLTNAATGSRQLSARERAMLAFKNELK